MKFKTLILTAAMAFALPSVAMADDNDKKAPAAPQLTDLERGEVVHRHHVNLMEIEMGNLAKKRGSAPVKKYGAMLVTEHTAADKTVKALARLKGVTLTSQPVATDDEAAAHDKMMELMGKLATLEGAAFDAEYLPAMVEGHNNEISRLKAAIPQVTDAKVKALLEKTLPSLQKHADGATKLLPTPPATAPTPPPINPPSVKPPSVKPPGMPPKPTPMPAPGPTPKPVK